MCMCICVCVCVCVCVCILYTQSVKQNFLCKLDRVMNKYVISHYVSPLFDTQYSCRKRKRKCLITKK